MAEFRFSLVTKAGMIKSVKEPHSGTAVGRWLSHTPPTFTKEGHPFVRLKATRKSAPGDYSLEGRIYRYQYRLFRPFWARQTGQQMIWIEGNPTPVDFRDQKWKSALDNTAFILTDIAEADPIERLLKPPKIPWGLIIAIGFGALMAGLVIGQYIGGRH